MRRWYVNEIADAYGGTVPKCVGYKAQGSGIAQWLAWPQAGATHKAAGTADIPVSSNIYMSELADSETLLSGTSDSGHSFKVEVPAGKVSITC